MNKNDVGKKNILQSMAFILVLANFLVMMFCVNAFAGGLYLNEFATPSMGTAGAGSGAWANDASTALHNPAGMTRIDGKEFMFSLGFLHAETKFDPSADTPNTGGDGGDAGGTSPLGGFFYTQSISDKLSFGISMSSTAGAVLDYEDTWTGRYQCQDVSIMVLTLNPTIAYKVSDQLSVAAGLGISYGDLELDVAIPRIIEARPDGKASIDGDDIVPTFNLSGMYELTDKTRLGLVYWYESDFDFSGDVTIAPSGVTVGVDTNLILPQSLEASIYHELNDKIALVGTFGWEDWSKLDYVNLSAERGTVKLPKQWDDTWHYAGGIHYNVSELWMLQCGIAYDTSPTSSEYRTADMPVDRQVRYAVGTTYEFSKKLTIGTAFEYADYGSAKINHDSLKGEYDDNQIYFGGVNFNWKF